LVPNSRPERSGQLVVVARVVSWEHAWPAIRVGTS